MCWYTTIMAVVVVVLFAADSNAEDSLVIQSMGELSTPPFDTIDAERVRLWIPIERSHNCRVNINILDSLDQVVRSLLNRPLSGGYYNFYWNKQDDYGRFVKPGHYKYVVDNCGARLSGDLEVYLHPNELTSRVDHVDSIPDKVWLTIEDDSVLVSITITNKRGRMIDQSIVDSLMAPGRHELKWIPKSIGYTGVYLIQVNVGGYTHRSPEIRASKGLE
jgi:hypothetical protein